MRKILLFLFCLLIGVAFADTPNTPKYYQIDFIVFTHISDSALQSENWPNVLKVPFLKKAIELTSLPTPTPADTPQPTVTPVQPYQLLPNDNLGLKDEAKKLENNSNYKILLHLSWQQPIDAVKDAKWIHIYGGQAYDQTGQPIDIASPLNPTTTPALETQPNNAPTTNAVATPVTDLTQAKFWQLNGRIRISQFRYFSINTQLYLTMPESLLSSNANKAALGDFQPIPLITFRLFENRRTKLNQLNYLDHPLFGALIKITRVQIPDQTTSTPKK